MEFIVWGINVQDVTRCFVVIDRITRLLDSERSNEATFNGSARIIVNFDQTGSSPLIAPGRRLSKLVEFFFRDHPDRICPEDLFLGMLRLTEIQYNEIQLHDRFTIEPVTTFLSKQFNLCGRSLKFGPEVLGPCYAIQPCSLAVFSGKRRSTIFSTDFPLPFFLR